MFTGPTSILSVSLQVFLYDSADSLWPALFVPSSFYLPALCISRHAALRHLLLKRRVHRAQLVSTRISFPVPYFSLSFFLAHPLLLWRKAFRTETAAFNFSPIVTASSTGGGLRFTCSHSVSKLRLEVYADSGQKVFDTKWR